MTIMQIIKKNLKMMIEEKGISVAVLSKLSNVSESTIRGILNLKLKTTNTKTVIKIANALNVTIDDLLKRPEE